MRNKIKYVIGLFVGAILISVFLKPFEFMFGLFWGIVWTSYAIDVRWL